VVLIVTALLPRIVSSDLMKPYVMQMVNQQIPGELQVKVWSLSWFGNIEGQEIVYDNRREDLLARIAEFKTSRGILGLILGRGDLGAVDIIEPAVFFYISEKSRPPQPQDSQPPGRPPASKPDESMEKGIPAFYGHFKITNGSLHTVAVEGNQKVIAKNLDVVLNTPGPLAPITYQFSVKSGDGSGQATGEGTLTLAADDPLNIKKIKSDSKLSIENWELENISAIIASRTAIPAANGRLNAKLALTGSSEDSLHLLSDLSFPQLKLLGGPLGSDTPVIKGISIKLDASGGPGAVSLKDLAFDSSLANGSVNGTFDAQGRHRLSGNADIDLAEVFKQVPGTLNLREGTKITQGKMALSAGMDATGESASFAVDARIDQLKGISGGKKLAWDKPITINARGEIRPEALQLDTLSLRSAFLNADGQGDLKDMKLNITADIRSALKELKKFIQIKQWDGGGNLELNLRVKEKSNNISNATLKLDVKDFELGRNGQKILPKQNIRADAAADINVAGQFKNSKLLGSSLNIQSSVANGKFSASNIEWKPAGNLPNATNLKLDGSISLKQLSSLLRNIQLLSPQIQLGGQSKINAGGSLKAGLLVLDEARVDTQQFTYRQDKKSINENRLILTARGRIDLNQNSLLLAPVDIQGRPGKIQVPQLAIADWTNAQTDMKTNVTANLDLGELAKGYGDFVQLPPKTQISGKGTFDMDVDFSNPKAQYLKLRGNLAPFKLASPTLPTISEKKVSLDADLKRSPDGKQLTIDVFKVDSNALKLTADGKLEQTGKNKVFEASGTMAPDLKLVSEYLKKTGQGPVEMTGTKATPFTIKLVSKGDRWEDPLKHLNFSGSLHVDSVKAYGLILTPQDVPIRLVNASADAKLESPANGGRLAMQPIVDMRKEPYVLSFKENIDILKEVKVTQGLVDGLLATLHPLFKNAVMPEGILGLHMKNFSWPLSKKGINNASFAGTLQLNGMRLNSTPFLSQLLDMMRVGEREIIMSDQSIDFEALN
ncbi:MAG: hypothetical protein KJP06_07035, partial [Deltaproteobacteria bacterium]|nr:hypothetical protein [Deltaproteobacteria bacterium]